ncbi:1,4-alpha-glucan branching protein GlgB [Ornithinimicrobium sp. Y1847]|uniref:1,4-alpha-glucan branching protein GlgB n=1 Tax=Ornithinimicrobium sp. Y1847 TaxID=3405419 RepID=UPI003B671DCD
MATLSPVFEDFLPAWVSAQRWFRGKSTGSAPRLRRIAAIRWEDPFGEVGLEDHLLVDESGPEPIVYQVPLSYRAEPVDFLAHALVATTEHSELGTRYVYDATHDPVFAQTLLTQMFQGGDVPSAHASRVTEDDHVPALRSARVLSGEQSNTSIIIDTHDGAAPIIVKLFRVLHSGENPDVTIGSAVGRSGNRMVPAPIGYVEGRWPQVDGTEATGHLAYAQEFVADTQDAWRTALEAARSGTDFADQARGLGQATASVHGVLREAFATQDADSPARATLVDQMRRRAEEAFAEVPELADYREAVESTYAELEHLELPALQRVHGDYHLGQVLDAGERGWVLLDFEGEPLRPLEERNRPDLALRDVAGMLRSFDYAAASAAIESQGEDAAREAEHSGDALDPDAWASSARAAFLEGYTTSSGEDLDAADSRRVLDALELDKALYEVVYEARNRPSWVPIPVAAVQRLVTGGQGGRHRSGEQRAGAGAQTAPPTAADFGVTSQVGDASLHDLDPAVTGPSHDDPEVDESVYLGTAGEPGSVDGATDAPSWGRGPEQSTDAPSEPEGYGVPDLADIPATGTSAGMHDPVLAPAQMVSGLEIPEDSPPSAAEDASDRVALGDVAGQPDDATDRPGPTDGQTPDAASGQRRGASGSSPGAPVPPPEEMVRAFAEPGPRDGEGEAPPPSVDAAEAPLVARRYPPASGRAPRPDEFGDPTADRDRAWQEAHFSDAVVTGGLPDGVSPPVRRVLLDAPTEPPAPHTRPLDLEEATDVVHGLHRNPHTILGAHAHQGHITIRTVRPDADAVTVLLADGREIPMRPETGGIWVAVLEGEQVPAYRLRLDSLGRQQIVDEAYRYPATIGQRDLELIARGRHEELWKVLGSHVMSLRDDMGESTGTRFSVWAPNALAVHVIGDFNGWDGASHALRVHEPAGVWELFVPGVEAGAHYKFDITGPDGTRRAKADPMARASEVPPFNNSVVTSSNHRWSEGDAAWMQRRAESDAHHGPMSIYEVHLGSWRQGLKYEQLADQLVPYVQEMGFTHVELMPVMQHPYGPSWGYHVTGYYAADSRFGHEDGLRYLIDRLHQAGIGVILDWVPGHFATDPWALARFDGTALYEHPDPRKGWHPEWGSYIFDYGRPEVRNFLVANATYWLEEFHADGLRVDGVASMLYLDYSRQDGQWIPNRYGGRENLEAVELLQETNATAYRRNPGVMMIAEESTSWPGVTAPTDEGGLGFGFKWNMGWMHDTLDYLGQNPYARARHHHALTFALVYAYSEKYILPISHDEVVHGKGSLVRKMAGDTWQKFATTRAFLAYQWSHPGKQLLFMGSEFAASREWADGGSLDWALTEQSGHGGVQRLVRDLNRLYDEHPALWQIDHHEDGFTWLNANDAGRNLYSYLRWGNEGEDGLRPVVAVLVNFSGIPHEGVHVGLPYGGRWREVLNTDAEVYDGSGAGNMGSVQAYDVAHQHQPYSALVTVPPMGAVWLVPEDLTYQGGVADGETEPTAEESDAADDLDIEDSEPADEDGDEDEVASDAIPDGTVADASTPEVGMPAVQDEVEEVDGGQVSAVDSLSAFAAEASTEEIPTAKADTDVPGSELDQDALAQEAGREERAADEAAEADEPDDEHHQNETTER